MLKLFSIAVLFCVYNDVVLSTIEEPNLPEKVIYQMDDVNELFNEFTHTYNKEYDPEELIYRRTVFEENLIKLNRWNLEQPDGVFGIGPFTDMTYDEFIKTHAGCFGNVTDKNAVQYEPNGMAPESLDWRQQNLVTRVKNQQSCGSCYVFGAIGNIEGLHAKKHGQLIELSEQQGLDCNPRGCEGGFPHEVMQTLAKEGCMKESDYPYKNVKGQCHTDPNKVVVKVTGGQQLYVKSEEDLKDAVATYGPLPVSISIEERFVGHKGGVYKPTNCQNSQSYHAVLIVGYGSDGGTPYWLMKNSWGPEWCEGGYVKMIRGQKACHLGEYVATATVA